MGLKLQHGRFYMSADKDIVFVKNSAASLLNTIYPFTGQCIATNRVGNYYVSKTTYTTEGAYLTSKANKNDLVELLEDDDPRLLTHLAAIAMEGLDYSHGN